MTKNYFVKICVVIGGRRWSFVTSFLSGWVRVRRVCLFFFVVVFVTIWDYFVYFLKCSKLGDEKTVISFSKTNKKK